MKYEWTKTVSKSWKYLLVFGIPTFLASLIDFYPGITGMTLGTLITALANWLKHRDVTEF